MSSEQNIQRKASNYQYIFKLILIGNSGVGKSCILQRYMKHTFEETYKCTIGVDFLMKSLLIKDKTVKLQLWDTAGQEKYKSMVSSYYRGANVALIVFDLTSHASFDALPIWIENYYKNGPEQKNIILIGNKKDLIEERQVTQEEAETFSETNNMMYLFSLNKVLLSLNLSNFDIYNETVVENMLLDSNPNLIYLKMSNYDIVETYI